MISPITWLWNIKHRKLIEETRKLFNLSIFLRNEVGLRKDLSIKELKVFLDALKQSNKG